jgi:hypothetical protein
VVVNYSSLWVFSRDGTNKVQFDRGYDFDAPLWSRDSKKILFTKTNIIDNNVIYSLQLVEINDWKLSQINLPQHLELLAWTNP